MKEKLLLWIQAMAQDGGQGGMIAPLLTMALAAMSESEVVELVADLRAALAALDS